MATYWACSSLVRSSGIGLRGEIELPPLLRDRLRRRRREGLVGASQRSGLVVVCWWVEIVDEKEVRLAKLSESSEALLPDRGRGVVEVGVVVIDEVPEFVETGEESLGGIAMVKEILDCKFWKELLVRVSPVRFL
jgi:hypothetical protein